MPSSWRLVPFLISLTFISVSLLLTALLPFAHVGSGFGPPRTLSSTEENALAPPLHGLFNHSHAALWRSSHASLLSALCAGGGGDGADASVAWFLAALRAEGLAAEELRWGGARVVHSVLRAGAGAAGTSALLFASPLPASAGDVAGACDGDDGAPATPHGALLLLALARALASAPWRAADIAFVFFYDGDGYGDGGGGGSGGGPCGDWGPLGLAGCYGGGGARGARASVALAAWARVHRFDALAEAEGGAGAVAGAAWRRLALREWAAAAGAALPHGLLGGAGGARARAPALQPLRHAAGPVRAAVVLQLRASRSAPPPVAWEALTQGANGAQADSDLFASLRRAFSAAQLSLAAGPARRGGGGETPLRGLAAAAWALAWGPSGPHGELLAAGVPAVTVRPAAHGGDTGGGAVALGAALEAAARSLNGLDEGLHAGARGYVLLPPLGGGAAWRGAAPVLLPLPEYALPIALFHAPTFALLLLPAAPPRVRALLLRGALPWAAALAAAAAAYVALMHGGATARVAAAARAALPRAALPAACGAREAPFLAWAWCAAGGEVVVGCALAACARAARAVRMRALLPPAPRAPAPPRCAPPPPPVAWALLVQAVAFFPLLYFNAPLAWVEAAAAAALLVGAAGVAAAAPLLHGPLGAALPSLLWLLASPLHALLLLAARGGEGALCAFAGGVRAAAELHATYGAHHVPVLLLLLLPLHATLAAAL
jgi:hypothetical protein